MVTLPLYNQVPLLRVETERAVQPWSGCKACSLHEKAKNVCMPPQGQPGGLLVIAESPTIEDDKLGKQFSSRTGAYVREQVEKLWAGPVMYDTALRCPPGDKAHGEAEVQACRGYLAHSIEVSAPKKIIALGSISHRAVLGCATQPMSIRRGYAYTSAGIPVHLLFHPMLALSNRFLRSWFEDDLRGALLETPPLPPYGAKVYCVQTVADAEAAVKELLKYDLLTLDAETFGAVADVDFALLTLSFTPEGSVDSYVWETGLMVDPPAAVFQKLAPVLLSRRVRKGGMNVKFDANAVRAGIGIPVYELGFDVQIWRRLLYADAATDLATMQFFVGMGEVWGEAQKYVDEAALALGAACGKKPRTDNAMVARFGQERWAAAVERVRAGQNRLRYAYAGIPPEIRARYCASDTVSTELIRRQQLPDLQASPGAFELWNTVGVGMVRAVAAIEFNGIKASVPAIRQLQHLCTTELVEVDKKLARYGQVLPSAPGDVARFLYDHLKLKVGGVTGKGHRTTDAATLEQIGHPAAALILEHRTLSRFKGQYAGAMESSIRSDGRIHPSIRIEGTVTGRPSCQEPNLMNIPRADTPLGKMCRDVFVAEDGWELVEADQSQIEIRVAAMLSGDPLMIKTLASGQNFHLATAKMIAPLLGIDARLVTKDHVLYSRAKVVNFAVLYGMDAFGVAMDLKITWKQAQAIIDAILGHYKRLAAWIRERLDDSRKTGETTTWWNGKAARTRALTEILSPDENRRKSFERCAWNTPIQGTAAEFTNASVGAVQDWIEADMVPARLVLTVYDSIMVEARKDVVAEVGRALTEIMTSWPTAHGVPLKVDLKHGYSWGSMQPLYL